MLTITVLSYNDVPVAPTVTAAANQSSNEGENKTFNLGSFSDPGNAERMRRELAGLGPVQIMALSGSLGTFYRVRVGPLNDASAAESTLQQVVDAGHADARLIVARSTL